MGAGSCRHLSVLVLHYNHNSDIGDNRNKLLGFTFASLLTTYLLGAPVTGNYTNDVAVFAGLKQNKQWEEAIEFASEASTHPYVKDTENRQDYFKYESVLAQANYYPKQGLADVAITNLLDYIESKPSSGARAAMASHYVANVYIKQQNYDAVIRHASTFAATYNNYKPGSIYIKHYTIPFSTACVRTTNKSLINPAVVALFDGIGNINRWNDDVHGKLFSLYRKEDDTANEYREFCTRLYNFVQPNDENIAIKNLLFRIKEGQ